MRDLVDSDKTFLAVDPIRKIRTEPYTPDPTALDIGFGTSWGALAAAWLTEWERGGDPVARQRLMSTMRTIGEQNNGFVQGGALYNLHTGEFAIADPPAISVGSLSSVFATRVNPPHVIKPIDETNFVSTNASSQYGLAAIQCLALAGDHIPGQR